MVLQATKWRYGPLPSEITDETFRKSFSLKQMQHFTEFTQVLRWLRGHFDPKEKMLSGLNANLPSPILKLGLSEWEIQLIDVRIT